MAPFKQPPSLFSSALSQVSGQISEACDRIFLEHGYYDSVKCQDSVSRLQKFLTQNLTKSLYQQLTDYRHSIPRDKLMKRLCWNGDPRIKFALYLHPNLTSFTMDYKDLPPIQQLNSYKTKEFHHDDFSLRAMSNLRYLVSLKLDQIATDLILTAISSTCAVLERIEILPLLGQIEPREDRSPYYLKDDKSCVTDSGILEKLDCRCLRHINLVCRHTIISIQCWTTLVNDLDSLEYVSYPYMGLVLEHLLKDDDGKRSWRHDHRTLRLTHFKHPRINLPLAERLVRYCPHVTHLTLTGGTDWQSSENLSEIMDVLALSSLRLKKLDLTLFPYDDSFEQLLSSKSETLTDISFSPHTNGQVTTRDIVRMGELLPLLEKLRVFLKDDAEEVHALRIFRMNYPNVFRNLEILSIRGRHWNPAVTLPIILTSAMHIFYLHCEIEIPPLAWELETAFNRLFLINGLHKLRKIEFGGSDWLINDSLIKKFVYKCPSLTSLAIWTKNFDDLRKETEALNMDITFN